MEEGTTASRKLSPPLIMLTCPGGGGHYWMKVNPRWMMSKGKGRASHLRDTSWCPDHQEEKKAHVGRICGEVASRTARQYASQGLPETKRCAGKKPQTHDIGAVL